MATNEKRMDKILDKIKRPEKDRKHNEQTYKLNYEFWKANEQLKLDNFAFKHQNSTLNESFQEMNQNFKEFSKAFSTSINVIFHTGWFKGFFDKQLDKERKVAKINQFEKSTGLKWDEKLGNDNYKTAKQRENGFIISFVTLDETQTEEILKQFEKETKQLKIFAECVKTEKVKKQKITNKNQSWRDKKHKVLWRRK